MKHFLPVVFAIFAIHAATAQNKISDNGNVGINTTIPQFSLDVNGTVGFKGDLTLYGSDNNGQSNSDSPNLIFQGTDYAGATMISAPREQTYGRRGFAISTHSDQSNDRNLVERLRITYLGDVGIGTTTPDAKLAVNGTIHCREVRVDVDHWPDYVFKPDYNLPSLEAVKIYIDNNKHLPDLPSEREVDADGINLGEIVKLQIKKIEELTLYLIEKEKQISEQKKINLIEKAKNKRQDQRIEKLEKSLFILRGI
jgi:hypothetical protein